MWDSIQQEEYIRMCMQTSNAAYWMLHMLKCFTKHVGTRNFTPVCKKASMAAYRIIHFWNISCQELGIVKARSLKYVTKLHSLLQKDIHGMEEEWRIKLGLGLADSNGNVPLTSLQRHTLRKRVISFLAAWQSLSSQIMLQYSLFDGITALQPLPDQKSDKQSLSASDSVSLPEQ